MLADIFFRFHSDERVLRFSSLEEDEGRDAHDAELLRDFAVLVHVHFVERDFACVLRAEFLDDRNHGLARAAPWSPKVDEDRDGRFQDFAFKFGVGEGGGHTSEGEGWGLGFGVSAMTKLYHEKSVFLTPVLSRVFLS